MAESALSDSISSIFVKNPKVSFLAKVYPDVAYPRRGKTRQSVPQVGARRLGQDEQYLTVREVLSEASTAADGVL